MKLVRHAPDTTDREPDWRDQGSCGTHTDPDLWYAGNNSPQAHARTRTAQAICHTCPVRQACGEWALATRQTWGVWGGTTEGDRRQIFRKRGQGTRGPRQQPALPRPGTLAGLWEQRTQPLPSGHLAWMGNGPVKWNGRNLTAGQIGFTVDRGRPPVGRTMRTCEVSGCVLPAHLADDTERMRCGTRAGYQRHLREGAKPCGRCCRANADADNRLRRTGTAKAAA